MTAMVASLLLTASMTCAAQQLGDHDMKQFRDPASGVSFQYPSSWRFSEGGNGSVETDFPDLKIPPRAVAYTRNSDSSPYRNTTFVGAEFLYASRAADSREACSGMIVSKGPNTKVLAPRIVHGIKFAHVQTADAWTC